MSRPSRRRGSVIIVVLVLIALASLLLGRFMEDNTLELSMASRDADRRRLRADAQSELELALAVIAEIRAIDLNKVHHPTQGFDDPHAYAGFPPREGLEVKFEYEDESRKLPLPNLDKNTLIKVLYALGLEQKEAERVADALVGWTSKRYEPLEEEATDAAYERRTLAHRPARRPLRSFEELRAIGVANEFFFDEQGRPTPLYDAFTSMVSLYAFGDTNINTAEDPLLLALGLDEHQVSLIRDKQNVMKKRVSGTPPYFRVTQEVRTLVGGGAPLQPFDDESHLMWVRVTVKEGLARCRISALVQFRDDVTFPAAAANPDEDPTAATGLGATKALPVIRTTGNSTASAGSVKPGATSPTPGVVPPASVGRTSLGGRPRSASLNYPFTILEWTEDNGPIRQAPKKNDLPADPPPR
jgi:general secretion pathway protein K